MNLISNRSHGVQQILEYKMLTKQDTLNLYSLKSNIKVFKAKWNVFQAQKYFWKDNVYLQLSYNSVSTQLPFICTF